MVLYTVMPPEAVFDETGSEAPGAGRWPAGRGPCGPSGGPGGPVDLFLGWSGGVPVWAEAVWAGDGWMLRRLHATDPALFLEPGLAPGSRLPLPM